MKKTTIFYWVVTGLFAAFMTFSSVPDIMVVKDAKDIFKQLGYPMYLIPFIGIAKMLGVIAVLTPAFPRLKEWAYAGLFFDLIGAAYSCAAIGGASAGLFFFILPIGFLFASYFLYHKMMKERSESSELRAHPAI